MRNALGDHRPATLATSSFVGVISSSCSYASAALAKSLFSRGADFTASVVFMAASTNLVVELQPISSHSTMPPGHPDHRMGASTLGRGRQV